MKKSEILKLGEVANSLQVNPHFQVFIEYVSDKADKLREELVSGACEDMVQYASTARACRELDNIVNFCERALARADKFREKQ